MTKNSKKVFTLFMILSIIIAFVFILSITKNTEAASGYSVINSKKIFDKSSLDTLRLNITELPEITIEGGKKYTLKDEDEKRKVIYDNVADGENIDSTITVVFNNCGILHERDVDIKIIYSNMIGGKSTAAENQSSFYWTAFGTEENQLNANEWWYQRNRKS